MTTFHTHTLPNGLRLVCSQRPSPVVYCGIVVDAGTRDELPEEHGMAHFAEHLAFKGTKRRSALSIINRADSVGGDLNAYTGKEETVYTCAMPRQHYARAVELLLDITLNSTYPQKAIDKEAEVVADEIESYNDSPAELIYDDYDELIFPHHPLGRSILGEAQTLRTLTTEDMRRFALRLYRPERMALYLLGDVSPERLLRTVERHMPPFPNSSPSSPPRTAPKEPPVQGTKRIRKDTHQTHVLMGTRCHGANHPTSLPLLLLNNILGGPAMNSRLNLALRERRGLVYTVESSKLCYTDTGAWNIYFGCDPHDAERCIRLASQELSRLCSSPLTPRALTAAKRQIKGQISIAHDNLESVAISMGKRLLHYGATLPDEELFRRIDSLSAQDLLLTAQTLFDPSRLTTLIYD